MRAKTAAVLAVGLLALAGCAGPSSNETAAPVGDGLDGPTWSLESVVAGDVASQVQGDATLDFTDDGGVRGSAGCHGFHGDYLAAGDDEIRISSLEIDHSDCPAEIGDQETRIFEVIGDGFHADVDGDTLTVTRSGSDVSLVYRAGDAK